MALLIFIKNITTTYDSPNIAFHCGNAQPWYYNDEYITYGQPNVGKIVPFTCTQKPVGCSTGHYYQDKISAEVGFNLSGYVQYGSF